MNGKDNKNEKEPYNERIYINYCIYSIIAYLFLGFINFYMDNYEFSPQIFLWNPMIIIETIVAINAKTKCPKNRFITIFLLLSIIFIILAIVSFIIGINRFSLQDFW